MSDSFLTNRVHIDANLSMVVMSIGQVAEIATMLVLGFVLARLGWKWTMVIGILGHALRFGVFAFCADWKWLIIAIQILHGICYAFFFATVYIFVDDVFPKDVRASAQGLFNLLILGIGMVLASFFFPAMMKYLSVDGVVDWQKLFLIPTGLALLGIVLLAVCFRPPTRKQPHAAEQPVAATP
jgi:MFS family permease